MTKDSWSKTSWLLGFAFYFFTHCFLLSKTPGFHYDEAWAAQFSLELSTGKLGFPFEAMSPYTMPWSHWIAALFFKLFHPSLFIYRLSGIFLSAGGVFFLSLALFHEKKRRAAQIFIWTTALSLSLILNHRFCIEITTFQVFCFGLLIYGLTVRRGWIVAVSLLFGITSHILFIAPALATWITLRIYSGQFTSTQRRWTAITTLFLFPFLVRVFLKIPEREKSIALCLLNLLIFFDSVFPAIGNRLIPIFKKPLLVLASLISLPCFAFLLFFAEGHWSIRTQQGWIAHPEWIGLSAVLIFGVTLFLWYSKKRFIQKDFLFFFFWSTILISLVATKPAPRYFEIPILQLFILASLVVESLDTRKLIGVIGCFFVLSATPLWLNYYQVGFHHLEKEAYFKFYVPRDNSSDFLPKQKLAIELGQIGCSFSNVQSGDLRILAPLQFLSVSDWPVSTKVACPYSRVEVSRQSQRAEPSTGSTRVAEVGPFAIEGIKTMKVDP